MYLSWNRINNIPPMKRLMKIYQREHLFFVGYVMYMRLYKLRPKEQATTPLPFNIFI